MDFYQSIADYYDYIFPYRQDTYNFLAHNLQPNAKLLDVACGTGTYTIPFLKNNFHCSGIDLDQGMITQAKLKNSEYSDFFHCISMLELLKQFPAQSFDRIYCIGNSLVHLLEKPLILQFFQDCKTLLKPGGNLLIQILHYNRVLRDRPNELPLIEHHDNPQLSFHREYLYPENSPFIQFKTTLKVPQHNQEIQNNIPLYPLLNEEIQELVGQAGFHHLNFYGNFKGEPHTENSYPTIFIAE